MLDSRALSDHNAAADDRVSIELALEKQVRRAPDGVIRLSGRLSAPAESRPEPTKRTGLFAALRRRSPSRAVVMMQPADFAAGGAALEAALQDRFFRVVTPAIAGSAAGGMPVSPFGFSSLPIMLVTATGRWTSDAAGQPVFAADRIEVSGESDLVVGIGA